MGKMETCKKPHYHSRFLFVFLILLLISISWIFSAGWFWKKPAFVDATEILMTTTFTVKVYSKDRKTAEHLVEEVFAEARRIEQVMEPINGNGELESINSRTRDGWYVLSSDLSAVLRRSSFYYDCTGGAFDPTIGSVKWLWDFENGGHVPPENELKEKLESVGLSHVELRSDSLRFTHPQTRLDLGGVAKGYAVDRMIAILKAGGSTAGLVNAGGDITMFGKKPGGKDWVIALRHPRMQQIVDLDGISYSAVATSGDYERFFMKDGIRYHHILDPVTGYPARGCISVTTWATSVMDADILSTAIFVMGPKRGLALAESLDNVETLIFYEEDGRIKTAMSSGIKGRVKL